MGILGNAVSAISDDDLVVLAKEIIEWHKSAILPDDSMLRRLADTEPFVSLRTHDTDSSLDILEKLILRESTSRWIGRHR